MSLLLFFQKNPYLHPTNDSVLFLIRSERTKINQPQGRILSYFEEIAKKDIRELIQGLINDDTLCVNDDQRDKLFKEIYLIANSSFVSGFIVRNTMLKNMDELRLKTTASKPGLTLVKDD